MSSPVPIGADAVIPPRGSRLASRLRLGLLQVRAQGRLSAGRNVQIGRGARVRAHRGGRVRLSDGCLLGPGSRVEAAGGEVAVGAGARLGERSVVVALSRVSVGARATVGPWAVVSDVEPSWADPEAPVRSQPLAPRPIEIGDGASIGAHAALGAGARVPPGAAIGSYAVVPTPVAPLTSP